MGSTRSKYVPFFDSFHDQGAMMTKKARMQFYEAIITYRFEGVEPTDLCKEAQLAWLGARPILEKARAAADKRSESLGESLGDSQSDSLGEHSVSYRRKEKGDRIKDNNHSNLKSLSFPNSQSSKKSLDKVKSLNNFEPVQEGGRL